MTSPMPRRLYPNKDQVLILKEVGWTLGPIWHADLKLKIRHYSGSNPDRLVRSQAPCRLRHLARYEFVNTPIN